MTNPEFSSAFDLYFNNITSNQAPGLDEYEKSEFLTAAQEQLVRGAYNGSLTGVPFEVTEEVRRSLSNLVDTKVLTPIKSDLPTSLKDASSYIAQLDFDKVLFIVYEEATLADNSLGCASNNIASVVPTTHDAFKKTVRNPFRGPNEDRVLRLDVQQESNNIELISKYKIGSYLVRYIRKPRPIILEDLVGISIDGQTEASECELPTQVHRYILDLAVKIAKQTWLSNQNN